ncbi:MAG: polysaccharide biosynthesis/export family protein [Aliishimia sp.]
MNYSRRTVVGLMAGLVAFPSVATAQGYRIQPGDVLRIEVIEDETLNRTVLVGPDGRINVPQAGSVRAAGRSISAIERIVTNRLTSSFNAPPNVYVALEQLAPEEEEVEPETLNVFVLGEVERPGKIEVEHGTTLIQAFAEMGGFSNFAATKRVQLRRTDPKTKIEKVHTINYDAMLQGQIKDATIHLRDGDVILVPTRKLFE